MHQFLTDDFHLCRSESVFVAQWLQVGNYEVKHKSVIALGIVDGEPEVVYNETVASICDLTYFFVTLLTVHYYDQQFHAY